MIVRSAAARLAPVLVLVSASVFLWGAAVQAQATRGAFGVGGGSAGRSSPSATPKGSAFSDRSAPGRSLPGERLQSSPRRAPVGRAPGPALTDQDTRRLNRSSRVEQHLGSRDFGARHRDWRRWVDSRRHVRFPHRHFRRGRFFVIHVPGIYSTWSAWSYYPVTPYIAPWRGYPHVDFSGTATYLNHGADTQGADSTDYSGTGERGRLAPFDPAPQEVVERMLALTGLSARDVLYDLGSGDGRVVIAAAKEFGVRAVGIEIDPGLVRLARENVRREGLENLVEIRQGDFMAADLSPASVVTLYLSHQGNLALRPKLLRELKPGARVVSYSFDMAEWQPKIAESYRDRAGAGHMLYLWEVSDPLVFSNRTE